MKKFHVRYFDGLQWNWIDRNFLADTEEQLRAHIDDLCAPEYRHTPKIDDRKVDSLTVEFIKDLKLPYEI